MNFSDRVFNRNLSEKEEHYYERYQKILDDDVRDWCDHLASSDLQKYIWKKQIVGRMARDQYLHFPELKYPCDDKLEEAVRFFEAN